VRATEKSGVMVTRIPDRRHEKSRPTANRTPSKSREHAPSGPDSALIRQRAQQDVARCLETRLRASSLLDVFAYRVPEFNQPVAGCILNHGGLLFGQLATPSAHRALGDESVTRSRFFHFVGRC
jgi:hypothetical protein